MRKVILLFYIFIVTMITYSNTTLNLSIPIYKKYIEVDNNDLCVVSFSVEVDKKIIEYNKNIQLGAGFGIEKLPKINKNINKSIKIVGGDATVLPLFLYSEYKVSDKAYIKFKLGYAIKLDSEDITIKNNDDKPKKYENDFKSSIFLKSEIGYKIKDKKIFIFHKLLNIDSRVGNNYSTFGIGFATSF